jgi:hypothetical protein
MPHQRGRKRGQIGREGAIGKGFLEWTGRCLERDGEADCDREDTEGY